MNNCCCTLCGQPDMYCECDIFSEKEQDEMWSQCVDKRPVIEYRTDNDIEYEESIQKPEPTPKHLSYLYKEEIEMLVDLGFE